MAEVEMLGIFLCLLASFFQTLFYIFGVYYVMERDKMEFEDF